MFQPQPNYLSLGAGVQSTVVAFMSARGELPPLTAAIFADTGWEPSAIYRHLDWMETQLPFPAEGDGSSEFDETVAWMRDRLDRLVSTLHPRLRRQLRSGE